MSAPSFKRRTIFSPTQIAGCQLWLDAADSNTLTLSGSSVTAWNDKSGNNYHMNTLTPSARWTGSAVYPTIGTSINGLQTVNFLAQSGLKQGTTLDGVKNLFWVGRIAAPVGSGDFSLFLLGHDSNYDWHGNQYGNKFLYVGLTQSGILNASPTSLFTNDVNAIRDATFSNVNMPTAPNVSILSVAGITGTTRYQGICYDRGDNPGWCGDLAEVIIFSTALSDSDRQTIEGYLAQKWGLTGSLPQFHAGLRSKIYPSLPQNRILNLANTTAFTPRTISGCAMWLDGTDPAGTGVIPSNGATISTWVDKSGTGTNLTAVGTPTYVSASSSVYLSGGSYLQNTNFNFTSFTLFIVAVQVSANTPLYTNTRTSPYSGLFPNYGGSIYFASADNGWLNAGSPFSYGTTYMYSIRYDSLNNINLWSNGGSSAVITGTAGTMTRNMFILGKRDSLGFTESMTGNVFEVIQYNTALTTLEREQVEGYLAQKWGLQANLHASHSYKSAAPTIIIPISRPRTFISFIGFPPLYSFTSFTFTNAGATLQSGPTLSQCRTAYTGTSWLSEYFTMTTNGYQIWTVPNTQNYAVICAGAATNSPTNGFGYGVVTLTVVSLTRAQLLQILVGQMGALYPAWSSCGGGGSFLASGTTPLTGECIVAAGGGGGFHNVLTAGASNQNATTSTTGNRSGNNRNGGTAGSGGSAAINYTQGGAGFIGNGGLSPQPNISTPLSFKNGGTGGATQTGYYGGFGGGGAVWSSTGGGGGGGYSGGAGGDGTYGGGGGSFPSSSSLIGYNKGQGYVSIFSTLYSSVPSGGSISISSFSFSGLTVVVSSPINSYVYAYYITTSGSSIASPLYSDFYYSSNTFNISLTITPGTTYYAAVVGFNNSGSSSPLFSSPIIVPGTISSVTLSDISSTGGTLTWTTSSLATGYNWYVGTGYGTGVIASGSTALLTTSFTYNLTNSYYYGWVQPTSTNGTVLGQIAYSFNIYYTTATGTLYNFTSFSFTNAGATFRFGPTLGQCQSAYAGTSWLSQYFTMTTQGYQLWTTPATGTYTVICAGAASATNTYGFGYGAIITTTISLTVGQQIQILVGQMGQAQSLSSSGGGGGSFIATGTSPGGSVCLVAAGGGGGWSSRGIDSNANASLTTSGNRSIDGILGGSNGNGGAVSANWAHSGAGFLGNGNFSLENYVVTPSLSFVNGGNGGTDSYGGYVGSFGGGGVRNTGYAGGGGGGGYSGGGASYSSAGGGGSFPSNATFMGYNQGQGFVDIYSGTFSAVPTGGSVSFSSFSQTQVSISISPATNVIVYDYYITTSASSIANPLYSGTTRTTTLTLSVNLQKNTLYYVAIVPKNPFGSGTTVFSNGYLIPGDTVVGFTSMSTSGFTLSWTTSLDAVSYAWSVTTGVSGGGTLVSSGTTTSLTTGAVSVSLSAGTNYYGYVIPSSSSSTGSTYRTGAIQISGRADFTYVGYLQTYTVPSGVSSVTVTLRGGGGGGGGYALGGAGAYVNGTMAVTAGQTYYIIVGAGGFGSLSSGLQSAIRAFGAGGLATPGGVYAGNGGGRSAIQNPLDTDYVNAGGGGGSGYGAGGAGGAVGTAGTSAAGGSAGAGGTLDGGPSYQGGDGTGSAGNVGGGGGGGGYRGGSATASGTVSGRGGGGGGSSLTSNLTNVTVTTAGGGSAGTNYQQGGNGSITIVV